MARFLTFLFDVFHRHKFKVFAMFSRCASEATKSQPEALARDSTGNPTSNARSHSTPFVAQRPATPHLKDSQQGPRSLATQSLANASGCDGGTLCVPPLTAARATSQTDSGHNWPYGVCFTALFLGLFLSHSDCLAEFRAGAYAKNIDPKTFPVWVNGGFSGYQVERVRESIFARCLVLDDGTTKIAIAIVDNCLIPHEVTDRAKVLVHEQLGLPESNVLIAATHTHSSVSVMGALGTPPQEDYTQDLPTWIAEGIAEADRRLEPAQMGTASVVADKYIYCRDWLMKPGTATTALFTGQDVNHVSMNPGYENQNKRAPVGSIDRLITVLSIQNRAGEPLALLSSFGTHYAGTAAISSDYFGVVCQRLAKALRPDAPEKFVGLMANGTSGNANCIDFSKPREPFTIVDVGNYVSDLILSTVGEIKYDTSPKIGVAFDSFDVAVRMPTPEEAKEAKEWMKVNLQDRMPKTQTENYARETVLLSEMSPTRRMNVQVFSLGDFAIAANPCESYGETGLKIRQASPFGLTMNIGLANGHCGYIPPPEMFQLGGYTTWRARTACLEEYAEPKMVDAIGRLLQSLKPAKGEPTASTDADSQKPKEPVKSPVSPEESLSLLQVEKGYEVELAIAEPLIVDPIAMHIDAEGKLWVVEMRDYPNTSEAYQSQIAVLRDTDGDGKWNERTIFADQLRYATGVQPWQNGAFVTVEGELLLLRDTDGDGKADRRESWLQGFTAGNPQLRVNHPTLTPDGWLTMAGGLRLGKVSTGKEFPFEFQSIDATGGDLRVHLLTGKLEAITGPTQYGFAFDLLGNRYGCSNRIPCFHVELERSLAGLGPLAGQTPSIQNVLPADTASRVYPLVEAWTTSNLHAGQFTAACGLALVQPQDLKHARSMQTFICEPTGSLVQRRELVRTEKGLVGQEVAPEQTKEFLASYDSWFRPVDLYLGPTNALYVVDMYRAVIEHPEWVPAELKERPDERYGDTLGRIYRIRTEGNRSKPDYAPMTLERAFASLASSDRWLQLQAGNRIVESMASGELKEKQIESLRSALNSAIANEDLGTASTVVQLLSACQGLTHEEWSLLLKSPHAEFNTLGLRSLREVGSIDSYSKLQGELIGLLDRPHVEVLHHAIWGLVQAKDGGGAKDLLQGAMPRLVSRIQSNPTDKQLWQGVAALYEDSLVELLGNYMKTASANRTEQPGGEQIEIERIQLLASRARTGAASAGATHSEGVAKLNAEALKSIQGLTPEKSNTVGAGVLLGILAGGLDASAAKGIDETSQDSLIGLASQSNNLVHRQVAIRVLGLLSGDREGKVSKALFEAGRSGNDAVEREAILALAKRKEPTLGAWICENYGTASTATRSVMFAQVRSNPVWGSEFVEALENKKISIRLLDPIQLQYLGKIEPAALRERAQVLVSQLSNSNREKVVQEYQSAMAGSEVGKDPSIGRELFAKHCASCHRLDSVGVAVGPDISDSRIHTYEKLLVSILDPNRSIDANYFRYLALTEDGETVEGLLREANAKTVVLESQNGVKRVLPRDELTDFKSSGVSMMPDGFEQQLPPKDMAELLWYIKNWRYVASGVPATARLE